MKMMPTIRNWRLLQGKNITNKTVTNYPDVTTVTGEPLLLRGSTGSLAGIYLKVMQLFLDKLSNEVLQSKNIVETSGPSWHKNISREQCKNVNM